MDNPVSKLRRRCRNKLRNAILSSIIKNGASGCEG
jgi:hypothetical protein